MQYFLQGLTLGLAYVAPIGLQNLFVINTALTQPKRRVVATALIVIFFDVTLSLACFFGIGVLMERSTILTMVILCVGSLIVLWIGIGLIKSPADASRNTNVDIPILKVISTACVVTWFNPQALIDGTMLIGAFRATIPADQTQMFIIGMALASVLWFSGISTIISIFSSLFNNKVLRIINIVCGAIIICYGVKLFVNFIHMITPYLPVLHIL